MDHTNHEVCSSGNNTPNDSCDEPEENNDRSRTVDTGNGQKQKMDEMFRSLFDIMAMPSSEEIAQKFALMSQSPPLCNEMRKYGYLPVLIQLLYQHQTEDTELTENDFKKTTNLRRNLGKALRNIINNSSKNKREIKVLRLLEDLRAFVDILYLKWNELSTDSVDHPCNQMAEIVKISSDQDYKQIIELLGGVYVITDVIQADHRFHKDSSNENCYQLRRYSLMVLTNMTFNNSQIKSLLGSMKSFMNVLISTLQSPTEDLIQAVADVLRNLSWKTDYSSRQTMRDVKAVTYLAKTALRPNKESTLKAILAALWNLTAHCSPNKADFCKVNGAIEFIISTLSFSNSSPYSMSIVESGGGILRNISSFVATNEEYREILRKNNVIPILLEQLESSSLDVVSNACITLSNLSARSTKDQMIMLESNALKKLGNLTNSKHKMIKVGASTTLNNLLTSQPYSYYNSYNDGSISNCSNSFSSLHIRKMKAMKNEIANCSTENYDSILDNSSPKFSYNLPRKVSRSNSHDSIGSTHSEPLQHKFCSDHKLLSMTTSQDSHFNPYHNFSGQIMNSMYATLPANSRICDKDNTDISSDYDICCGDAKCQMNMSSSTIQASFLDNELEVDPEPTDYSKRYKEQPVDDFTAPRSANKTETGGCEDSVKVYQTEGTPLAFSLAPSLSDLRDLDLKNVYGEESNCKPMLKTASPKNVNMALDDITENFCSLDLKNAKERDNSKLFKKPILPPKPKFNSSSSAYNLKNLSSINEETLDSNDKNLNEHEIMDNGQNYEVVNYSPNSREDTCLNSSGIKEPRCDDSPLMFSRSSSINSMMFDECRFYSRPWSDYLPKKEKTHSDSVNLSVSEISNNTSQWLSMKNNMSNSTLKYKSNSANDKKIKNTDSNFYYQNDSAIRYATEDTPAIFSHATSLSSLTVDDNLDDLVPIEAPNDELETGVNGGPKDVSQPDCDKNVKESQTDRVERNESSGNVEDGVQIESSGQYRNSFNASANTSYEDCDMLEACITSAMMVPQKKTTPVAAKRYSKANQKSTPAALPAQSPAQAAPVSTATSPVAAVETVKQSANQQQQCSQLSSKQTSSPTQQKETAVKTNCATVTTSTSAQNQDQRTAGQNGETSTANNATSYINNGDKSDSSDDDDEILQKCIENAMPVQKKKSYSKSPRFHKRQSHGHHKHDSVVGDQKKQFFVEDTPVHFSECHSSLSSLSFDSADEINDNQVLEAAISLGMNRKIYPSSDGGGSVSLLANCSTANKPPLPQTQQKNVAKETEPVDCNSERNTVALTNGSQTEDGDDDDKTYTICTQNSRNSHTKTGESTTVAMSDVSTVSSVVDLESTNPPSMLDDHIMFSSCESNVNRNVQEKVSDNKVKEFNVSSNLIESKLIRNEPKPIAESESCHHSFEENNASLLENTKPPSIIDHSSLMSQSTASITSEISDIAYDQVPIRKSSSDIVAAAASSCAKEINNLVQSCMNVDTTSSTSRQSSTSLSKNLHVTKSSEDLLSVQMDKTFEIEPTSRTLPRKKDKESVGRTSTNTRTYNKNDRKTITNGPTLYDSDQSDTDISEVLPLDDVKMCVSSECSESTLTKNKPTVLYNKPMDSPKVKDSCSFSSRTQSSQSSKTLTHNKIYPLTNNVPINSYGQNFEDFSDNELNTKKKSPMKKSHTMSLGKSQDFTFQEDSDQPTICPFGSSFHSSSNVSSHSLGRRSCKMFNSKADFEDKDLLFTAKHKNMVSANQALYFQNKSNLKTASKYFDRHPMLYDETHNLDMFGTFKSPDSHKQGCANLNNSSSNSSSKTKEKTSLLSNVKSKISASLSSHNLGSSSGSVSSSSKSSSKKIEVKSKIASLWKRSKSTHDKLDQEILSSNPIKNMKATELNRSVNSRRSFGKSGSYEVDNSENGGSNLLRSSTYEKLPLNDDEATNMGEHRGKTKGADMNVSGGGCINSYSQQANKFNTLHYGSLNNKKRSDKLNGNFTFTTFVKSLNKSNSSNGNSNNFHHHSTCDHSPCSCNPIPNGAGVCEQPGSNNNHDYSDTNNNNNSTTSNRNKSDRPTVLIGKPAKSHSKRQTTLGGNSSETEESSSSSSQPRKTCLVTTV